MSDAKVLFNKKHRNFSTEVYKFNIILGKLPITFFTELEQKTPEIYMETQKREFPKQI